MNRLFGTDGIRGLANRWPMVADFVVRIGMAIAIVMKRRGCNSIVIGKDTRVSGYMIESALVSGFTAIGMNVTLVGPMPTPAVAMLTRSLRADLGVMLSASHNPYHDNGIKLFDSKGNKLSVEVENLIEEVLRGELESHFVEPDDVGRAYRLSDAPGRYIEFVKNTFPKDLKLSDIKVVVDCANGAAYHLGNIFWELGADVEVLNNEPNGFNINLNCGSMYPESVAKKVLELHADIGFALDGDADRVLVCDERGQLADGDQIIAAIAKSWKANNLLSQNCVVATIMSSLSLETYLSGMGIKLVRAGVGDRNVMETMRQYNCNLGGEKSGHVVLSDYSNTGDGLVTALQILAIMCREGKSANAICHSFIPTPQVSCSVAHQGSFDINHQSVREVISEAEHALCNIGRVVVRKSGTEKIVRIMAEGEDAELLRSVVDNLNERLTSIASGWDHDNQKAQ